MLRLKPCLFIYPFIGLLSTQVHSNNPASIEYVNKKITELRQYIDSKVNNQGPYTLGQQAQGGIIGYLDASGLHGLSFIRLSACGNGTNDLSTSFTCVNTTSNYPSSASIYTDWVLPTRTQLNNICTQTFSNWPFSVNTIAGTIFSSTEQDPSNNWGFNNCGSPGTQTAIFKTDATSSVIAVRNF